MLKDEGLLIMRYIPSKMNAITNRIHVTDTGEKSFNDTLSTIARNPHKKAVIHANIIPLWLAALSDIRSVFGWLKYINIVWSIIFIRIIIFNAW